MGMENLDKLSAAGVSVFDCNGEHLDRTDWSQTRLGARDGWPPALKCLVNSCIMPIPHCAAIFWGDQLGVVYNLAWERARGDADGQGSSALETYSGEAQSSLRSALRGRTIKVAAKYFLNSLDQGEREAQVLLSTLLDEHGEREGILAQLLAHSHVEKYIGGLDELSRDNPGRQVKFHQGQQEDKRADSRQVDTMQTQLFQRFAELLPNGLAILDSEAEAVFVNDGFFKLTTNKSQNEFRAWPESIHPGDYERVMSAYRQAFTERQELRCEFRCAPSADGEEGDWRLFLLRPLSDEPDAGFISAIVDITEIKQAELTQERAATEAQDRKEQQERFIDMVSHEIRNPLSAVMHLAEEIRDLAMEVAAANGDLKDQVADLLDAADTILLCVSHQNTLVDDILSFSKLDSMMLSLVPHELRPKWEFSQALKVFQSEFKAKSIDFHYAMDVSYDDNSIDYVVADLNRMKQVLVNLITNAIKFTSKKNGQRRIVVSMGASTERPTSYPPNVIYFSNDQDAFHVDSTKSSEWGAGDPFYLMVAVKDTGIGISDEGQAKLFERFRQATPKTQENYGGSGLGLFISRKLCQLHGGDIGVSSKEGEGSTFGFFFKVRRSDGTSDGRPPFQSRSNSEASQSSSREKAAHPARPSYGRANSNLAQIKERNNERPEARTLTSHSGVTLDEANSSLNKSLINPPTEYIAESHPQASSDQRFEATEKIARDIEPQDFHLRKATDVNMIDLQHGETKRQENIADDTSRSQRNQRADEKQTLLLVEDNLINQRVLRRQLQSRGFEVFIANNGQEAIDAVAERGKYSDLKPNDRNYFDCVLMDQEMPVKDGNVATQEIRALQQQGKAGYSHILGVSANVREAQTQSMRDAGMDDIISKPFKVDDLVKRIRSIILEDGGQGDASKHGRNNGPPAIENAEVRMLEDLPPKDNREGSEQTRVNSEHGRPEKSGSRGKGSRESGGRARIELGGNAQEDRSTRNANSAEGGKGTTTSWQEDKGLRDGRREMREEQDRKDGEKGKRSGREGEARGGERSRERHDK